MHRKHRKHSQVFSPITKKNSIEFGLQPLKQWRKNHRLALLTKILQEEERHEALAQAYDKILRECENMAMTTRADASGQLTCVYAASHGSILQQTTRDTRASMM